MTKTYRKNQNNFYVPKGPIKCIKNYKTRLWFLVDARNVLIAENLLKDIAHTVEALMNSSNEILKLLKELYDLEGIVVYKKEEQLLQKIHYREILVKMQYNILKSFKFPIKWIGTQDYHKNLWEYFYNLTKTYQQKIVE